MKRRRIKAARTFLLVISCAYAGYVIGILDLIFATPYSKFRWPPFVDVKEQLDLMMRGKQSTVPFENSWETLENYRFRPSSKLCTDNHQPLVLIAVKSGINHFDRRAAIRQLWGRDHRNNTVLFSTAIFVLGRSTNETVNEQARQEHSKHGDLLMGNFIDAYTNVTFKFISALQFFVNGCRSNVSYLLLIDDDYHISIRNLVSMLSDSSTAVNTDLYTGYRFSGKFFLRPHMDKHYVPLSVYPFSAFPPFIAGGAVLLSRLTAQKMLYASYFVQHIPQEDIYAGIIALLVGIESTHDERFVLKEKWTYKRDEYSDVVAAHGFADVQLMRQAFFDSDGGA